VNIPSKEAIEFGRSAATRLAEKLRRWEQESVAKGDRERAERNKWAAWMVERDLLGQSQGCVIAAFDERWLDDEFRSMMEAAKE
jgi:hypothetical protein